MKNTFRNVILICAMCAVVIMCVGLLMFDYIPTSLTVSKANQYETAAGTTEVLSDAQEAQSLLTAQSSSTSSTSANTPAVKTNIVLKEYDISKTDLAMYKASGSYQSGRADPFAEVTEDTGDDDENSEDTTDNSSSETSKKTTPVSDGTFYNSSKVK